MQQALSIRPGIVGVIIVGTASIARILAHLPLVAAEVDQLGRWPHEGARSFDRRHRNHVATGLRQNLSSRGRSISVANKKRCVVSAEMNRVLPVAVSYT